MTVSGVHLILILFSCSHKQCKRLVCQQCVSIAITARSEDVLSAVEATVGLSHQRDDVSDSQERSLVLVCKDCLLGLANDVVGFLDESPKMGPIVFVLIAKQHG